LRGGVADVREPPADSGTNLYDFFPAARKKYVLKGIPASVDEFTKACKLAAAGVRV
jgi:hypothetical protein